ncbi:MAG: hypothetical protein Q9168_007193 [Polycauliona sp. 1 TL-2023]
MAQIHELRVLCFGASITAGYYSFGLRQHPYATRLKYRLQARLSSHQIQLQVDGLSGDRVIGGQYLSRLQAQFDPTRKDENPDWIIFQGGGNDLLSGEEPGVIFEEMKRLWQFSLHRGTKVLALTVTDTEDQRPQTRRLYSELNQMIMGHQHPNFFGADLFGKIQYTDMSQEERKLVWDDGLHFKPRGYDMIGDAVADRLLAIIQTPSNL